MISPTATKTPKILIVGSRLSGGGAENHTRLLAKHLFGGSAKAALFQTSRDDASEFEQQFDLGWRGSLSNPRVVYRLARLLRREPFDALISLGFYPNTFSCIAANTLRRRPALLMMEITRPHTASLQTTKVRHILTHAARRLTYPLADLALANSDDGLDEVVRHYGVPRDRIRRVPNIVEPDTLESLAREDVHVVRDSGSFSICVVARLDPVKRIDTIIEATAGLPRDLPCFVDILGDGPEKEKLQALVAKRKLEGRVCFHGWSRNPCPLIRRANALVLTSELEGFSNTVLEALVLGTPVVTSFCSSDARAMVVGGAALGFPVGDHGALSAQLMRLFNEPELRRTLGEAARRFAEQHCVPDALQAYEDFIREAICRREHSHQSDESVFRPRAH